SEIKGLAKAFAKSGATLTPVDDNLVDALRGALPERPPAPVILQPLEFAGRTAADKIAELQATLREAKQDAVVVTSLDSIAWLFNIRGGDLPHTPFVLSHAVVPAEGKAGLFLDSRKLSNAVRATLADVADIDELTAFPEALAKLGAGKGRVRIDAGRASQWIADRLKTAGAEIQEGE